MSPNSNFESCVWRAVSSHSSHHPQGVLLAQFGLCVHTWAKIPFIYFLSKPETLTQCWGNVCPRLQRWPTLNQLWFNVFNLTRSAWGSTLDVKVWRLYSVDIRFWRLQKSEFDSDVCRRVSQVDSCTEPDVCRRQVLTTKVDPALQE